MTPFTVTDHFVVLLPYLRLKRTYAIVGVEFVPLRDTNGEVPTVLQTGLKQIETILSSYVDREGNPLTECVVATVPERGWDLTLDKAGNRQRRAAETYCAELPGQKCQRACQYGFFHPHSHSGAGFTLNRLWTEEDRQLVTR